ncbi:MAG: dockerin type I repeat-containing protein [Planctomycetota bacterium]
MNRFALFCLIAFTGLPLSVSAQEFPVRLSPENPTSCDVVELIFTLPYSPECFPAIDAACEGMFENRLRLALTLDEPGCPMFEGSTQVSVPLGIFPAGVWQFQTSWTHNAKEPLGFEVTVTDADCGGFIPGDANGDRALNISDPVATLQHLFGGLDIGCRDAADANDDGELNVSDPITMLSFLFQGGDAPGLQAESCQTGGKLGCEESSCGTDDLLGPVWVAKPDGCLQCDPKCPELTATDAAEELVLADVRVSETCLGYIGVCEACNCPSGRFFVARVPMFHVQEAAALGWEPWGTQLFLGR